MPAYGLIGKTLSHSFSKKYFADKFNRLQLSNTYENFECDSIADVKSLLEETNVVGFNVTAPYKAAIMPFLDGIDEAALKIGAVNTLLKKDGKWKGYNTDVYGFKQLIKPFFESHHERAIIIGSGGAAKSVAYVLEALGCEPIFISRQPKDNNQFSYQDINKIMISSCPIIVNTTPVGTFPNVKDAVDIPYNFLGSRNLVIDLVYNPVESEFLKRSRSQGATVVNGLTMLHQQAEKSWEIWQSNCL
jgi:shikimate dehydrogenase